MVSIILCVVWFRGPHILYYWDDSYIFNSLKLIKNTIYGWTMDNLGSLWLGASLIPTLMHIPASLVKLPIWIQQQIFYVILIFTTLYSINYFINNYSKFFNIYIPTIAILGGSLLYIFNYFSMVYTFNLYKWHIMAIAFLPLALGIYIRELAIGSNMLKRLGLTSLVTSIAMLGGIKTWPTTFLLINVFILYLNIVKKTEAKKMMLEVLCFNILTILLTTYMWMPSIVLSSQTLTSVYTSTKDIEGYTRLLILRSGDNTILNTILFTGVYKRSPPYTLLYSPGLYFYLVLIAWIFAILPALRKKNLIDVFPHMITLLASILFISILNTPLREIYIAIYRSWYGFTIFNDPWPPLGYIYVLAFSYMFARGVGVLYNFIVDLSRNLKKFLCKSLIILAIVFTILHAWPMITGDFVLGRTSIPSTEFEIADSINNLLNDYGYNVLILPAVPTLANISYSDHDNKGYVGNYIVSQLINAPVIGSYTDGAIRSGNDLLNIVRGLYYRDQLFYWNKYGAFADLDANVTYVIPRFFFDKNMSKNLVLANMKFFSKYGGCVNVTFKGSYIGHADVLVHTLVTIDNSSSRIKVFSRTIANIYSEAKEYSLTFNISANTLVEPRVYNTSNVEFIFIGKCDARVEMPYAYQFFISLRLLNVKYVVIRGDVAPWPGVLPYPRFDYEFMVKLFNFVEQYGLVRKVKDSNKYTIYEVIKPMGLIYIPDKIICANLSGETWFGEYKIPSIVKALSYIPIDALHPALVDMSACKGLNIQLQDLSHNVVDIDVTINTPTMYYVKIINASSPILLILSQNYDLWKAFHDNQEVRQHIKVNGYANAWIINITGSFNITLLYGLEEPYRFSLIFTFFNYIILMILVMKPDLVRYLYGRSKDR